ncbi:hypothetical protein H6B10_18010, partial [Gemmiger formicilis]|uniref:hypothetical protein n=1 Tax=Gemmiger formicilis TaxID=745368 RepID=UPI00195BBB73
FYALNSSYYARWYYMPVLVLCGATAYTLERPHLAERQNTGQQRLAPVAVITAKPPQRPEQQHAQHADRKDT